MSQKSSAPPTQAPAEKLVRDIRRATRKYQSAEGKIRIVVEGHGFEEGIEILKNRSQRVSLSRFPFLLQSLFGRTGLAPQAST